MSFFLNSYFINLTASSIPIIYYDLIYDQYWDNTVLLLHGDTSLSQPNITDNSSNSFSLINYGLNKTVITDLFSQSCQGSYFNGTATNYLTFPTQGIAQFSFDGDFTIEAFIYKSLSSDRGLIITTSGNSAGTGGLWFGDVFTTNKLVFFSFVSNSTIATSTSAIPLNQWTHLAVTRSSGTLRLFINGVVNATATNTQTFAPAGVNAGPGGIGAPSTNQSVFQKGIASNIRIVKGSALYTTNFTPPTSPLTLTTNGGATPSTLPTSNQVSLLILNDYIPFQNNTFLDSSLNNFTITRSGTPTQGSFNPFALSAAPYYPSVNLGSGYFNGTTDYLTLADSEVFNLSTNNFTIECWVYFNSNVNQYYFGQLQSSAVNRSFCHAVITGKHYFEVRSGATAYSITSIDNITTNAWTHLVAVRNGDILTLYKNGTSIGSVSIAGVTVNNSNLSVGIGGAGSYNVEPLNGYISNARLVNGTALYTSNFSVPTSPVTTTSNGKATPSTLPSPSQVSLLCNFANAGIYDSTEKNNLITIGNASLSSSQVKYGSGSIAFDGSGDELYVIPSDNFAFRTENFTIECWAYFRSTLSNQVLIDSRGADVGFWWGIQNNGQIVVYTGIAISSAPSNISLNTWNHIALVRSGTNMSSYINGNLVTTISNNTDWTSKICRIGKAGMGGENMNGLIDDLRITKGIARYTSNFTPPSRAFPDIPYLGVFALQIDTTKTGTTTNTQFNLALRSSTSYDFDIDWGDNVTETYTSLNTTGYTHTYPISGIYTVTIAERSLGGFPGVFYNNVGDKLKLLNINQFGGNQFGTNFNNAFYGCTNLQISASDFTTTKTQNIIDFSAAWSGCTSLTVFPLIDTSKGTKFNSAWYNCNKLISFPSIDTSKATSLNGTWNSCTSLSSFPYIETSECNDFERAWYICSNIKNFPYLNLKKATTLSYTWINCTSLPLSTFTILNQLSSNSNLTDISAMVNGCTQLKDFPFIDTRKVIDAYSLCSGCSQLTSFPALTLSAAQRLMGAWSNCTNLSSFPYIDISNATDLGENGSYSSLGAWNNCRSLVSFPALSTGKVINFNKTWYGCTSLTAFPLIDTSKGLTFDSAWYNCNKLTSFPKIDTLSATNLGGSWSNCTSLTSFPALNTPNVNTLFSGNAGGTWAYCRSLSSFPLIDTSKVTNFTYAWQFCTSLSSFPLISTDSANNFWGTWNGCSKLRTFPSLNFSKAKGTGNFIDTWNGCTSLTSFPTISAEGTISKTWMNCTSLTGLGEGSYLKPIGDYSFGAAFLNCFALVTLPTMDTLSATEFGTNNFNLGPWNNCRSLTAFPLIDTRNGTTFYGAWQNCYSLSASNFPTLNMSKMTNGTDCFNGVKLTTSSYSALLTSLCATNFNNSVIFHGGNSTFNTAGSAAKVFLTKSTGAGGRGWTITDGGYQVGT
jgi:hypothetical protein